MKASAYATACEYGEPFRRIHAVLQYSDASFPMLQLRGRKKSRIKRYDSDEFQGQATSQYKLQSLVATVSN